MRRKQGRGQRAPWLEGWSHSPWSQMSAVLPVPGSRGPEWWWWSSPWEVMAREFCDSDAVCLFPCKSLTKEARCISSRVFQWDFPLSFRTMTVIFVTPSMEGKLEPRWDLAALGSLTHMPACSPPCVFFIPLYRVHPEIRNGRGTERAGRGHR